MLGCSTGLVRDQEAGAHGDRLRGMVVGPDPGGDLLHAPSLQPGDHGDRGFGGESLALPGHATSQETSAAWLPLLRTAWSIPIAAPSPSRRTTQWGWAAVPAARFSASWPRVCRRLSTVPGSP